MRGDADGRRRRIASFLIAAAVVLAGGGCSAQSPARSPARSPAQTPASGPPPGVTVELRQLRSDVADRTAQVRVTNGSDADLEIDTVEFADERFASTAVRDHRSVITAGRTVDLRITLPASRCDGTEGGATSGVVTVTLADGSAWQADLPDPLGFLPPLHERECLAQRVAETADIEWRGFEPGSDSGALVLGVDPAGGDHDLVLVEVRETNLLQFPGAARTYPLGVAVDGAGPPSEIEIPLVPSRCDAHAVMEDKRGTVFAIDVRLDGAEGVISLPADADLKGELLAWVGERCGFPGG